MPDKPPPKRPATSGTRKGNGTGYGGPAKGAGADAPMQPPFEAGNDAAKGHHDMSRSERIEHLTLHLMDLGDNADQQRDQISATIGALRHLTDNVTKVEVSGPDGAPIPTSLSVMFRKPSA